MITHPFDLNTENLKNHLESQIQRTVDDLRSRPDKSFVLRLRGKTYNLRYEVSTEGMLDLFVNTPETSDSTLVRPTLRLNVGELLLPESIDLSSEQGFGYNPGVENQEVMEISDNGLSENELREIREEIQRQGLQNLLK